MLPTGKIPHYKYSTSYLINIMISFQIGYDMLFLSLFSLVIIIHKQLKLLVIDGKCGTRLHFNVLYRRLKPGGGGVNAAIFKAAGEALEISTKQHAETLSPGNSVVVPLPSTSPLHQREGVTHVIHVLGPNMNPQRPNCLNDDYVQGCNILRNAYSSLFKNFASISHSQNNQDSDRNSKAGYSDTQRDLGKGTTLENHQKAKREISHDCEKNKKCKGVDSEDELMELDCAGPAKSLDRSTFSAKHDDKRNILPILTSRPEEIIHTDQMISKVVKKNWGSWAQALHQIAVHPEKHKDVILEMSNEFVVLNDLYPKVCHLLNIRDLFLQLNLSMCVHFIFSAGKKACACAVKSKWP